MHIKRTIKTWSDKFKDLFFKRTNRFRFSDIIIKLILKFGKCLKLFETLNAIYLYF